MERQKLNETQRLLLRTDGAKQSRSNSDSQHESSHEKSFRQHRIALLPTHRRPKQEQKWRSRTQQNQGGGGGSSAACMERSKAKNDATKPRVRTIKDTTAHETIEQTSASTHIDPPARPETRCSDASPPPPPITARSRRRRQPDSARSRTAVRDPATAVPASPSFPPPSRRRAGGSLGGRLVGWLAEGGSKATEHPGGARVRECQCEGTSEKARGQAW